MSGVLTERIRRIFERAEARGVGLPIRRSVAEIFKRLIQKPREWGDPIRNLQHARLVEYHGRHGDFLAIYAVHDRIPMVFLNQLIPLPRNPLYGETFDG
jgi:hypothetical protein